jgi:hypothetical protein
LEALKVDRYRQGGRTIVQKTGIVLKPADLLAKLGKSKPVEIL